MLITLASTSKFKNEIFNKVGLKHENIAPLSKEESNNKDPYEYVKELSFIKATSVKGLVNTPIIIGLDTIVLLNNKILEKPKNLEEAKNNLINSSNNKSNVITGITIINKETNETITTYQESLIYFNEMALKDINYYLENEPDALYASGFIIETIASNFIRKIDGSFYNILGAPVEKIYEILKKMGYFLKDINN